MSASHANIRQKSPGRLAELLMSTPLSSFQHGYYNYFRARLSTMEFTLFAHFPMNSYRMIIKSADRGNLAQFSPNAHATHTYVRIRAGKAYINDPMSRARLSSYSPEIQSGNLIYAVGQFAQSFLSTFFELISFFFLKIL